MMGDTEARKAVRLLMEHVDSLHAQYAGLAYVLAKKEPDEYTRLVEAAQRTTPKVAEILSAADDLHGEVYAALDAPQGDWCQAVSSWLSQHGPVELGQQSWDKVARLMRLKQELKELV
jgi:hypothetical protein